MSNRYSEWQPIRHYGEGTQPRTGRHWNCVPAWDVTAIYAGPDGEIPHPDFHRARAGLPGEHKNRDRKKYVFWDRHVDRRFHIEYPCATKDSPRVQGTLRDPAVEWDTLVRVRDGYLRDAGLTPASPAMQVAKCLADSFGANAYFKDKPLCPLFKDQRQLNNGLEGVLYKSHCVGCSKGYAILADSLGLPSRNIGCGGHWVAEVLVDRRWRLVDSVGRHPEHAGTDLFYRSNYMECCLDPMGAHADSMEHMRDGFWRRSNPMFHLHCGMWASPVALRYAASNACAFYPEAERWAVFSEDGKRLPILNMTGGFYWPSVHKEWDGAEAQRARTGRFPHPLFEEPGIRDYFFHPFRGGEKLRQSVYLGQLDDVVEMEIVLSFAASKASDFSADAGRQLMVKIGDFERSLTDLGAWPPAYPDGNPPASPKSPENLRSAFRLPRDVFRAHAVNWIELHQRGTACHYIPLLPNALEPYIAPLWSETEDVYGPAMP